MLKIHTKITVKIECKNKNNFVGKHKHLVTKLQLKHMVSINT